MKKSPKWYVYELSDMSGKVFYVGKGSGNRLNHHERDARRGVCSKKCNKIRSLNYEIIAKKIEFFDNEEDSYQYEIDRIAFHGLKNLTNLTSGGRSPNVWLRTIRLKSSFNDISEDRSINPESAFRIIKRMEGQFAWFLKNHSVPNIYASLFHATLFDLFQKKYAPLALDKARIKYEKELCKMFDAYSIDFMAVNYGSA